MINIYLQNYGTGAGSWLSLPADEDDIKEFIKEHKISTSLNEEFFIADIDCSDDDLDLNVSEYDNVFEINEVITEYEELDSYEKDVVVAYMELQSSYLSGLRDAIDNIDSCSLLTDVEDYYDLGVYMSEGLFTKETTLFEQYFDYTAYGRDIMLGSSSGFTSKGFLFY